MHAFVTWAQSTFCEPLFQSQHGTNVKNKNKIHFKLRKITVPFQSQNIDGKQCDYVSKQTKVHQWSVKFEKYRAKRPYFIMSAIEIIIRVFLLRHGFLHLHRKRLGAHQDEKEIYYRNYDQVNQTAGLLTLQILSFFYNLI